QRQAVIPLHGPSLALLDTPVIVRCGAKHQTIRYRYALLADTDTGALEVLLWLLPDESGACGDLSRAARIAPNCIDEAEMIPDPAEFARGVPSDVAFAVDRLPPHTVQLPFPADLAGLVGKTRFTAAEARALELGLRKMLAAARR
ncbi:MAG: hypothetical protein K2V38_10450, partial [Gemmataceae bacterium]|nr:hypothetical protein [Gemmataceae bacterium]